MQKREAMIPLRALLASCPPVQSGNTARRFPIAKLRLPPFPPPERGLDRLTPSVESSPPLLRLVEDLMDDDTIQPGRA